MGQSGPLHVSENNNISNTAIYKHMKKFKPYTQNKQIGYQQLKEV
ncbi:hypothetical protein BSG1_04325 [Bacillus sp. SG-1]|nr:hypothetical protein BSG1_04325 [Bacillus sp. SG-1]